MRDFRSVVYRIKSLGPRTEPWEHQIEQETEWLKLILKDQELMYDLIQDNSSTSNTKPERKTMKKYSMLSGIKHSCLIKKTESSDLLLAYSLKIWS
jgi:hypothetical protein